jgi:hypothetical protein
MDTRTDAFSPKIYGKYPILDSIMIYYLDIESLIQRHQVNPAAFETRGSLNLLAQRFDLPPSLSFSDFLNSYDAKYATVRSYFLPGAKPQRIMLKAAEAGELQAFYLGLRRNPKYKETDFLNQALNRAARGGHQVMIDLIKDLGGTSFKDELRGTAEGGHLENLKLLIAEAPRLVNHVLIQVTNSAIKYGHLSTVKYLDSLHNSNPNDLINQAGKSGNQSIIDYVISQGGDNYTDLILGAIVGGHLEIVMRYMDKPGLRYRNIFGQAIRFNCLDLAKLVASHIRIDQDNINDLMGNLKHGMTYETIDYLISLGGNNYSDLIDQLADSDQIELFKRYYLISNFNYSKVFDTSLDYSSVKIVKFMLEQRLVPVTVDQLNRYLRMVGLYPEIIELLFSLGATDHRTIVERALLQGNLELAEKYFDQATGLRLNSIFKECTKIPVYRYLMSKGRITQETANTTLARLEQSNKHDKAKNYLRS